MSGRVDSTRSGLVTAQNDPALLETYGDDPSNVHHSYLNDAVVFRNFHAGPKETHVFHLHAHQWFAGNDPGRGAYLDSQAQVSWYETDLRSNILGDRVEDVGVDVDRRPHVHDDPVGAGQVGGTALRAPDRVDARRERRLGGRQRQQAAVLVAQSGQVADLREGDQGSLPLRGQDRAVPGKHVL